MDDPVAVERRPAAMSAGSVKNLVDRLSKDLAKTTSTVAGSPGGGVRERQPLASDRQTLNGGKTRATVRFRFERPVRFSENFMVRYWRSGCQ